MSDTESEELDIIDGDFDDFVKEEEPVEASEDEEEAEEVEDAPKEDKRHINSTMPTERSIIIIDPKERITSNVLQRCEATRLISIRAKQISDTPTTFLTPEELIGIHDARIIARLELEKRKMPLQICRRVGVTADNNLLVEMWNPREMALPLL